MDVNREHPGQVQEPLRPMPPPHVLDSMTREWELPGQNPPLPAPGTDSPNVAPQVSQVNGYEPHPDALRPVSPPAPQAVDAASSALDHGQYRLRARRWPTSALPADGPKALPPVGVDARDLADQSRRPQQDWMPRRNYFYAISPRQLLAPDTIIQDPRATIRSEAPATPGTIPPVSWGEAPPAPEPQPAQIPPSAISPQNGVATPHFDTPPPETQWVPPPTPEPPPLHVEPTPPVPTPASPTPFELPTAEAAVESPPADTSAPPPEFRTEIADWPASDLGVGEVAYAAAPDNLPIAEETPLPPLPPRPPLPDTNIPVEAQWTVGSDSVAAVPLDTVWNPPAQAPTPPPLDTVWNPPAQAPTPPPLDAAWNLPAQGAGPVAELSSAPLQASGPIPLDAQLAPGGPIPLDAPLAPNGPAPLDAPLDATRSTVAEPGRDERTSRKLLIRVAVVAAGVVVIFALGWWLLAGRGGGSPASPEAAMESFLVALEEGRLDTAHGMLCDDLAAVIGGPDALAALAQPNPTVGNLESFTIRDVESEEGQARVAYSASYGSITRDHEARLVADAGGTWCIVNIS